jgi:hypothetical protein
MTAFQSMIPSLAGILPSRGRPLGSDRAVVRLCGDRVREPKRARPGQPAERYEPAYAKNATGIATGLVDIHQNGLGQAT